MSRTLPLSAVAAVSMFVSFHSAAQEPWAWPEKPQNLQVMPKDWTGARLRPVMIGFTRALGVRCSYCHVGEEGKPLSTYDFAADENPNKSRAREMLKMLESVNTHLKNITPSGDRRVNMWCHTCHHGRPRPMTLEEELAEHYRKNGIESAIRLYRDLKKTYYGSGAYDFGESALDRFGAELLAGNDVSGAVVVLKLNAEVFPESAHAWDSLAEAHLKAGAKGQAEKCYEKSLELNPNNRNAREKLKKIREGGVIERARGIPER